MCRSATRVNPSVAIPQRSFDWLSPQQRKKASGGGPRPSFARKWLFLLERVIDPSEFAVQVGTQTVDRGNDCEGNTRGNQAVFDRGGTRLIPRVLALAGTRRSLASAAWALDVPAS